MKRLSYLLLLLSIMLTSNTGNAQDTNNESKSEIKESKVEVYYFHNTRRCATCNAVEDVTLAAIKEFYPTEFENGELTFQSLNLEEDSGEEIARRLNVSGQTLLIIVDGKKKDLTNDAFMYAKSKPEKFSKKIHTTIGTI